MAQVKVVAAMVLIMAAVVVNVAVARGVWDGGGPQGSAADGDGGRLDGGAGVVNILLMGTAVVPRS